MRRVILILVTILVSLTTVAQNGPFGFEKGMTRAQIIAAVGTKNIDPRTLRGGEVMRVRISPKPNPIFAGFMLLVSPTDGLIRVAAYGQPMRVGDDGAEIKGAYNRLMSEFTQKFGEPTEKNDTCNGAAIICKRPEQWMLTLFGKQRRLDSAWLPEKASPGMKKSHIRLIRLSAMASGLSSGSILCDFQLEGYEKYSGVHQQAPLTDSGDSEMNPGEPSANPPADNPPAGNPPAATPPSTTTPNAAPPNSTAPTANPPSTVPPSTTPQNNTASNKKP